MEEEHVANTITHSDKYPVKKAPRKISKKGEEEEVEDIPTNETPQEDEEFAPQTSERKQYTKTAGSYKQPGNYKGR
ncbi:hypothetical protein QTN25_010080 [Entamoeba marina]